MNTKSTNPSAILLALLLQAHALGVAISRTAAA